MATDNQISIELVLDDGSIKKSFDNVEKQAKKTKDAIDGGLSGPGGGGGASPAELSAKNLAIGLGLAAAAAYALKTAGEAAIDAIGKADRLDAINNQFELLARNAGLSADILRSRFAVAANGLVDDSDLIEIANKALINLGASASKLPDLLEVARKAARVSGEDIKTTFEAINNAVITGQTKQLKGVGIYVDSELAVRKYALSLGVSADVLNQAQKGQAILNAVLDKGKTAFKDIDTSTVTATDSNRRLGVTLANLGETIVTLFRDKFGPLFQKTAEQSTGFFESIDLNIKRLRGTLTLDEAEKSLKNTRIELGKLYEAAVQNPGTVPDGLLEQFKKQAQDLSDVVSKKKAEAQSKLDALKASAGGNPSGTDATGVDPDENIKRAKLQKEAEFQNALLASQQSALTSRLGIAQQEVDSEQRDNQVKSLLSQQLILNEQEKQAKIASIKQQYSQLNGFNTEQEKQIENAVVEEYEQKRAEIENKWALITRQNQIKEDAQRLALTKSFYQGLVNAAAGGIQKIAANLLEGKGAFDGFLGAVLGILGDMATQIGTTLVGIGFGIEAIRDSLIGLTGGPAIAAGFALIAVGALLKSLSGSNGGGSTAVDSGGGGIAGGADSPINSITKPDQTKPVDPKASVNVTIQGNVLDRRQTGLEIVDVLNEAFSNQGVQVKGFG